MVSKRVALILTALVLLVMLPLTAFAATQEQVDALKKATRSSYTQSKYSAGVDSFHGYCGKMTSYQLWKVGINKHLITNDGNKQFDYYSQLRNTTGGYYISAYSAQDYTLEEALMEITQDGTRDVFNLLVGFQWSHTEAGAIYGHAVFINGILDGTVYFVESFDSTMGGAEGNVIELSIERFVEEFTDWVRFDGIIWFGDQGYAHTCQEFGTDIIVRTRFAMPMRSQPCLVGQEECQVLRTVSAGERLHVTGVLKNEEGEMYYRVREGDRVGYITAQSAVLEQTNADELYIKDFEMPESIAVRNKLTLQGYVDAEYGLVGAVELVISDDQGQVLLRQRKITDSYRVDLNEFVGDFDTRELEKGRYTVSVYGETASAYVREGELDYSYATMLLAQDTLWVGEKGKEPKKRDNQTKEVLDGWYWSKDTWYCFDDGKPKTGWVRQLGVQYYLQKDGSVATGWKTIDGQRYCFASNGAMCVGWLRTDEGMRYSFSDGRFAEGWQTIGTGRYYFANGIMQTSGQRTDGEEKYEFQPDGRAVPVTK